MTEPDFSKSGGLIAAIAQDYKTGEVLMIAWMNREAYLKTLELNEAVYYSRSRSALWHKGETSGHVQKIKEIRIDCDCDALLLKVEQIGGAACHEGYKSCFFRTLENNNYEITAKKVFNPDEVYKK
ncbi:MAG: phosphoribosyl-AMP cyclohydrolase [Spirochaetes bacterium GWF1_41_5]|nr:MAG: phosphoribosyl-AMP cyclohydrolase [Spirochaetes bacterium GWF1_41_5]HBE04625.1 phosphoribosyl-AMP cyclohydrolase [Spirochaetia bacterium]